MPTDFRVHVAGDGVVWYGADKVAARCSELSVPEFLDDLVPARGHSALAECAGEPDSGTITLVGSRHNAALIVGLRGRSLRLCSPRVCRDAVRDDDPVAVLRALWQPELWAQLPGHWRTPTAADFDAYALTAAVVSEAPPAVTAMLLRAHPAWPALSFIDGRDRIGDLVAGASLLAHIVDPRWFRHPYRPNRFSRLHSHLGLTPCNARAVLGIGAPERNFHRARDASLTWFNPAGMAAYEGRRCGPPSCFLWRIFAERRTVLRGLLGATKRLVDLIALVWLAASEERYPELWFDPALFFAPGEQEAFAAHAAMPRKGSDARA